MTKQQYFDFAESFFRECLEISKRKNADYTGGSDDPFSNFTSVEALGIKTEHGFLTRMMDKMKRISAFVHNGELQVKDEAVTDTLRDLANYCCLLAGFIESGKVEAGRSASGAVLVEVPAAGEMDVSELTERDKLLKVIGENTTNMVRFGRIRRAVDAYIRYMADVIKENAVREPDHMAIKQSAESPEKAETEKSDESFWVEVAQAHGNRWYNKFVGSRFRVVENPKFTDSGKWYKVLGFLNDHHIEARHCKIVDGPHRY